MEQNEFAERVQASEDLRKAISSAGQPLAPAQFGTPTELAVIALMFPMVKFLIQHIGLPWAYELSRYSELQRKKFSDWIDQQYTKQGVEASKALEASKRLIQQLEESTTEASREPWNQLQQAMLETTKEED